MALSGLEIYKMLPGGQKPPHPKANCKECGYPTCLAFAMKLALQKTQSAHNSLHIGHCLSHWKTPVSATVSLKRVVIAEF